MSKQIFKSNDLLELFNMAWVQVSGQGNAARNEIQKCVYETSDNLKCAVGACLTPNAMELVKNNMEPMWKMVKYLETHHGFDSISDDIDKFLSSLQTAHDSTDMFRFMEHFENKMLSVSEQYDLGITKLEIGKPAIT